MKLLLFFVVLAQIFHLHAEPIPLFLQPRADAQIIPAERATLRETGKSQRLIITEHPLAYIHHFREMETPDGKKLYYRDDLVFNRDGTNIVRMPELPVVRIFSALLTALLLTAFIYRMCKGELPEWQLIFIPVLLRILLFLITVSKWDCVVTAATDEIGYFETMQNILNGEWEKPWRFTIGTGICYLPFMLICGKSNVWEIMPYFNYFSALVLAPGTLALGFLIMRKLGCSGKRAALFMLFWAIYPFISFHFEEWQTLDFQQFFLFPYLFTTFHRLVYYAFCINSGFNAMSDMPGLCAVMGCMLLALSMSGKYRNALLFGALYGFACLIRINYILLAPLFMLILFDKFQGSWKRLLTAAAISCGGFIGVFAIQLICNMIQFGSPFTFGYILHYTDYAPIDRPAAGFTWHTFKKLTFLRSLLLVNLPVFAVGTAALWSMKERKTQQILTLMAIPTIIFFCGYSHTFCDARRFVFPAFSGLLMACGCTEAWDALSKKAKWHTAAGILLMIFVTTPFYAHWKGAPFMIGDGLILRITQAVIPVYLTVLIFMMMRNKHWRTAVFIFCSALFFYAPVEILGAGMLLLFPWMGLRQWLPEKWKNAAAEKVQQLTAQSATRKPDEDSPQS